MAVRQVIIYCDIQVAEKMRHERGRSHAVHIVIAEQSDFFFRRNRLKNTIYRRPHPEHQKRIVEQGKIWIDQPPRLFYFHDFAVDQQLRYNWHHL